MKSRLLVVMVAVGIAASANPVVAEENLADRVSALETELQSLKEELENGPADVVWKNGFRLTAADGDFELRPRARIQADAAFYSGEEDVNEALLSEDEEADPVENGAEFRRARLGLQGDLGERIEFKLVYDFAGGNVEPKDVYLGITEIPYAGTIRAGFQREPFGRLQGGSAEYIFLEKGLQDALAPDRSMGLRLLNCSLAKGLTWSAGAYYLTEDDGTVIDEQAYSLTTRLTAHPVHKEGESVVHGGISYSYRQPPEDGVDYGARPESHLAPKIIGLEEIPAETVHLLGLEAAAARGPLTLQSELVSSMTELEEGGDANFAGYYLTASWFLTGENRPYDAEEGTFDRVRPSRDFGSEGWGAWEVAVRYSALDLEDGSIDEGKMKDLSAALNWYLNPFVRAMLNYVYSDADGQGDLHVVQTRLQMDF